MKMVASSRHSVRLLICLCLLVQPFAAVAQTNVPAPLPPAAQEAFDKGIMAAREQGYPVAIRFLQEARKLAPQAPQVFRSLGAVEARIPGRELRAMAWYGAYLAALPQAVDAAEVKNELARLEVKNHFNISSVLKSVQEAAKISGNNRNLEHVAELWVEAGDVAAALRAAELSDTFKNSAQVTIVTAQLKGGDIAGALNTADLIQEGPYKIGAQSAIAEAQADAGDIAGAQKTADLLQMQEGFRDSYAAAKGRAQRAIAKAQIKTGDIEGAQKTLSSALKTAESIENQSDKSTQQKLIAEVLVQAGDFAGAKNALASALKHASSISTPSIWQSGIAQAQVDVVKAQLKAGDIAGAQMTFIDVQKTAELIPEAYWKNVVLQSMASAQVVMTEAQLEAGDVRGAHKTAELIRDTGWKSNALRAIARAQIKAGDYTGAQKTADLLIPQWKGQIESEMAKAQAKTGNSNAPSSTGQLPPVPRPPIQPVITVSDWLTKLDDHKKSNDCPLSTEPFLDLADYLKSLPPSDDPEKVFRALQETGKTIIRAQNVITGMLKQQEKK